MELEKQEKIGNVILDYTYYKGKDLYSDGDIEDELLDLVQEDNWRECVKWNQKWPILYHLSDVRHNLLEWYPMQGADVLEIGSGCGGVTGVLSEKAKSVTCIELSKRRSMINAYRNKEKSNIRIMVGNFQDIVVDKKFDIVTLIGVWEYSKLYVKSNKPYHEMLSIIQKYLKPDGKVLIAIENKMGLKYWNGAAEDHTGVCYSGINDYVEGKKNVRTFSKPEIENILQESGFEKYQFYYPVPDYKLPSTVYSDLLQPTVSKVRCYKDNYDNPRMYNFYEAVAYDQIIRDNMFPYFANSFLVVAGKVQEGVAFAKYCRERRAQFRIATYIEKQEGKKWVIKKPLHESAKDHVLKMKYKEDVWKRILPNLECVVGMTKGDCYYSEYVEGMDVDAYLYDDRLHTDRFIGQIRAFVDKYLTAPQEETSAFVCTKEFVEIFGEEYPKNAVSLRCTNIDLAFSNLRMAQNGKIYCFDYEWIFDFPIPYEYALWRAYMQLYSKYIIYLKEEKSLVDFLKELGIESENHKIYTNMEKHFLEYVHGKYKQEQYLRNYRKGSIEQKIRMM
ncbi:MAG: class I SAM-dependent methyltransferase [Lachnospiraceae bacterium]|nr:class I SAM-dependent methyltransferase [Lachnospiraceae bacterium]